MIHTPEDFPDISSSYKIYSDLNQSSQISVSVSNIRADASLHQLSENDRKCFLYKKRTMRHKNFPSRRSNAENDCYSKCRLVTTYKLCKCMPYYFDVDSKAVPLCLYRVSMYNDYFISSVFAGLGQCCGIEHLQCLGGMDGTVKIQQLRTTYTHILTITVRTVVVLSWHIPRPRFRMFERNEKCIALHKFSHDAMLSFRLPKRFQLESMQKKCQMFNDSKICLVSAFGWLFFQFQKVSKMIEENQRKKTIFTYYRFLIKPNFFFRLDSKNI